MVKRAEEREARMDIRRNEYLDRIDDIEARTVKRTDDIEAMWDLQHNKYLDRIDDIEARTVKRADDTEDRMDILRNEYLDRMKQCTKISDIGFFTSTTMSSVSLAVATGKADKRPK